MKRKIRKKFLLAGMTLGLLFSTTMTVSAHAEDPDGKAEEAPIEEETPAEVELTAQFAGKRALLAEDNELNWEIASELISDLGIELDWAEDGKICADMFEQSPLHYYDVILMDLRMPVMTGYEAARAIRDMDREDADTIPIIAMSADAYRDDVQKCLDCGMNAHVPKPIDMQEVTRLLEKYLQP